MQLSPEQLQALSQGLSNGRPSGSTPATETSEQRMSRLFPSSTSSPSQPSQDAFARGANPFAPNNVNPQTGKNVTDEGLLGDVKNTVSGALDKTKEDLKAGVAPGASFTESVSRGAAAAGDLAGGAADAVFGAPLRSLFSKLPDSMQNSLKENADQAIQHSDIPKIAEAYTSWAKENPKLARVLGAAVNVGAIFPEAKLGEEALNAGKQGLKKAATAAEDAVTPLVKSGKEAVQSAVEGTKNAAIDLAQKPLSMAKDAATPIEDNVKNVLTEKHI